MHWLRFVGLLVVATLLQADLLNAIEVAGIKPDLLLILLAFFAVFCEPREAIITSFSIGLASDLIGPSMGPGILSMGLLGTGMCYLSKYVTLQRMPFQALAVFVLGFAVAFAEYILSAAQTQPAYPRTLGAFFGTPLYSAIVGPFLFLPVAWWMHIRIQRRQRRSNY